LDLAWQCRLTQHKNTINEHFAGFGTQFQIHGISLKRNSFEATLTASKQINDRIRVFGEFYGEAWSRFSSWNGLGGVEVSW
jgi:hypothetical protein